MTDFVAVIMTLGRSKATLDRLKRFEPIGQGSFWTTCCVISNDGYAHFPCLNEQQSHY